MPRRSFSEPRSNEQKRQRNKIRGVLGKAAARNPQLGQIDSKAIYREGFRKALLEARVKLPRVERDSYFAWLDELVSGNPAALAKSIALEPLDAIIKSERMPLREEFDWISRRIVPNIGILRSFRKEVEALNAAFWRSDTPAVRRHLETVEEQFGQSIWLIEARVGLEQYYRGIEAQKAYSETIKKAHFRGLPAYLAYNFSVRNEPRTTLYRFNADVMARIGATTTLNAGTKAYLRYRLADEFTGLDRDTGAILRVEQGQSIIDLYETAIDLLQKLIISSARKLDHLGPTLSMWRGVEDFRIDKILGALGFPTDPSRLPAQNDQPALDLLRSNVGRAYRGALMATRSSADVWLGIEAAFSLSLSSRARLPRDGSPWRYVVDRLATVFNRGESFERAFADLTKFARNLQVLPTAKALLDFVRHVAVPGVERPSWLLAPSLNNPFKGSEELGSSKSEAHEGRPPGFEDNHTDAPELISLWNDNAPRTTWNAAARAVQIYISGRRALRDGSPTIDLEQVINLTRQKLPETIRCGLSAFAIDASIQHDDLDAAVRLIADEAVLSEHARPNLPVTAALGGRDWDRLSEISDKLSLATSLDLLLRRSNDDAVSTMLRFCFEEYLISSGLERPSEIVIPADSIERRKVIYFLRFVCVPTIMEMFDTFTGSRDLDNERILICQRLVELDSARGIEYETELQILKNKLLIQDGLKLVDSSRIHVDIAGISRTAVQTLNESFGRYRALVEAGIGVAQDLDTVLRATVRAPARDSEYFQVPENEADATLLEIVLILRDQFLSDADHGLNFYLSKRIRHGTIAGYLRSPIEASYLITRRESENTPYKPNEYWMSRLHFVNEEARVRAGSRFESFAREIDSWIREIKDVYLQIRNKEHPKGLFEVPISAPTYHLIRSAIRQDLSFETFLQSCFAIFWALLEPSLAAARRLLVVETKDKFALAFDALDNGIRECTEWDDAFRTFSTAIRTTSAEVQLQIDMVSDWLRRTEGQQAVHRFKLEEVVDIATESALKAHKSFRPRITKEIVGHSLDVSSLVLVVLADILFILFDNVYNYARLGSEPRVLLRVEFAEPDDVLRLSVVNEAAPSARTQAVESDLVELRRAIADRSFRLRLPREGKSGFLKIANIVHESERGSLEFGFADNGDFRVVVALAVTSHSTAIAGN